MSCREGDADHDPHPTDEEGVDVCDAAIIKAAHEGGTVRLSPATDPQYRKYYQRGWRYGATGSASLDMLDSRGALEAEYDGYMDYATGRAKWALWHCRTAGGCREHEGFSR